MVIDPDCDVKVQSTNRRFTKTKSRSIITNISLTFFVIISFFFNGLLAPLTRRGFFCNDATLQYPVKSDTVSFKVLLIFALIIPIFITKFCHSRVGRLLQDLRNRKIKHRKTLVSQHQSGPVDLERTQPIGKAKRRLVVNDDDDAEEEQNLCKTIYDSDDGLKPQASIKRPQRETEFSDLQLFMFGFATTSLITGIGKTTCGRLRPHFMQRCKPNIDCKLSENSCRYIEDFVCTNDLRSFDVSYISTSWPSGESLNQLEQ